MSTLFKHFARIGLLILAFAGAVRAETIQYTYDADSHLTAASYNTNYTLEYVFDPAGNITQFYTVTNGLFGNEGSLASVLRVAPPIGPGPAIRTMNVQKTAAGTLTLSFSWNVSPNVHYELQCADSLNGPWKNIPGDISSESAIAENEFEDVADVPQRFFRLVTVP